MKSGSTVHDATQSLVMHLIQFVHLGNKLHVYMYRKVFKTDQFLVVRHSNYYIVQRQTFREKKRLKNLLGHFFKCMLLSTSTYRIHLLKKPNLNCTHLEGDLSDLDGSWDSGLSSFFPSFFPRSSCTSFSSPSA